MFKKLTAGLQILALVLILTGCASFGDRYNEYCTRWLGRSTQRLVHIWGMPDSTFELDGVTYFTYRKSLGSSGSVQTLGYSRFVSMSENFCKTTFAIENGVVTNYQWEGNSCY